MVRKFLLYIFIVFCFFECNISDKYLSKSRPLFYSYFELETEGGIYVIKNKEFRKISNFLALNYGAIRIRLIVHFKSLNVYYCEFYENDYTIICLQLDNNLKFISMEKIGFVY